MSNEANDFQVHPPTVHAAGQAATDVGKSLGQLYDPTPAPPYGFEHSTIGSTLKTTAPLWDKHLQNLGNEAGATGSNLISVSDNYSNHDFDITQSLQAIRA